MVVDTLGATGDGIDWFIVITGLFGGLAVFLFGMDRMTEALRVAAGARLRFVLARMTKNRFLGALSGAGVTAVIQSSSVTTVLVVGFISSNIMNLSQGIGVILGANVGTTVTAQIVAFSVSRYALMIVALGYGLAFFGKTDRRTVQGNLIMGLGLIFFGMSVMGAAMDPLRSYEPFIDLMVALENPLLAVLAGLAFTAIVQSSSATTGIVVVLASEGLITTEAGIALVLGANVGTSVTAQLAALGKSPEAIRAAVVHTLFNLIGALAWLPLVGVLAGWVESIGGPLARQIANAHTIFNVVNTVVFLAFVPQLERLVVRLVPDRPEPEPLRLKYLDDSLLRTPTIALERARLELLRMSNRVQTMFDKVLPALFEGPAEAFDEIEALDDEVDALHGQIIEYLGRVGRRSLSSGSTEELMDLMEATNNLEAIGDLIETNLVSQGPRSIGEWLRGQRRESPDDRGVPPSDQSCARPERGGAREHQRRGRERGIGHEGGHQRKGRGDGRAPISSPGCAGGSSNRALPLRDGRCDESAPHLLLRQAHRPSRHSDHRAGLELRVEERWKP